MIENQVLPPLGANSFDPNLPYLHSTSEPSQHMYDVVVEECMVILQYLTAAHQPTCTELPLQLPACHCTTNRSNDCLGRHSADQHFHIFCGDAQPIDSSVVNILDNKLFRR